MRKLFFAICFTAILCVPQLSEAASRAVSNMAGVSKENSSSMALSKELQEKKRALPEYV